MLVSGTVGASSHRKIFGTSAHCNAFLIRPTTPILQAGAAEGAMGCPLSSIPITPYAEDKPCLVCLNFIPVHAFTNLRPSSKGKTGLSLQSDDMTTKQ